MLRELGCVMWREKVRPFDPPLPERDLLGGQPPPLLPAPGAYAPLSVDGGWLWRSTVVLGVLRTALRYPVCWRFIALLRFERVGRVGV